MNYPKCPYVLATVPAVGARREDLKKIPGVKVTTRGDVIIPHHALDVAHAALSGLRVMSAEWVGDSPRDAEWEDVDRVLRDGGEVRDFVLDGFLMPYQQEALAYGADRAGVHFWHPTGSGKTLTGILWALLRPGPVVVITRAASRLQYGREIERFTNTRPYIIRPRGYVRKGVAPETLAQYAASVDRPVVVVGWEALTTNVDDLIAMRPAAVIFDESHRGKSSKRWESIPLPEPGGRDPAADADLLRTQAAEARSRAGFVTDGDNGRVMIVPRRNTSMSAARLARASIRRCCTTATPIKDRVRDLWGQLDLAEPDAWGNKNTWMRRHADMKPGMYGGMDTTGASNLDELRGRLVHCAHKIDYHTTHHDLPPKRRQSVYIAPEDQAKPTGGFAKQLKEAAKRGATAVLEVKLAQAASGKRKAVLGLIEDHLYGGQKVVVFTGRRRDCEELGVIVKKCAGAKKTNATVWSAHGGQSTQARQDIVDDYMAHPGPAVLVGTGDAFGEAINLHDTDAALFVMLPWTPGQIRQWEGRFVRRGMKRPVVIYYVISEDTVDEHVADALIGKLPAVEKIAEDADLSAAAAAIGGTEDEAALADSILEKLLED
jgi:superfamily II DNA or RNA helicase